ncbi:MAG: S9 family peptidase [Flavobacteriales bacterium]|nr:S9 family peptidase [Flavobacteriales bacterium]
MKNKFLYFVFAALIFAAGCGDPAPPADDTKASKPMPEAPVAKMQPEEMTIHGDTRVDNYFWMRLSDDQKKADTPDAQTQDVLDYLNAENAYKDTVLKDTEGLQQKLFDEIVGRIKQDDQSVPVKVDGYWYYTRYEEGQEYPYHCRKKESLEGEEEVMMNVNEMAEGYAYYAVGGRSVSPDNKLLAFGVDTVSRRQYTVHIKNLETGEIFDDIIPETTGGATWANDNKTLFYTKKDPVTLRSYRVYKHVIGTDASEDELVFEEADETFSCYVWKSKSKDYLMIGSYATLSSEVRFVDANNPNGEWQIIQPRERNLEYSVAHYGNDFYIVHNQDAKNFKLSKTSVNNTGKDNWETVIEHRDNVLLEGIEIFKNFLVVDERIEGLTNLRVMPWDGGDEHYLEFQDPAYTAYIAGNPEFDTEVLRYGYSSMTTPNSTYDYDMTSKERTLLKQQEVMDPNFSSDNYASERIMATAADGTKVPMSIVYRKGMQKDGSNPLLLYAYGSYGASMDPYFSSVRLSLLDRGFVYVIAHIRGGQEMGRQWYEDGKLLKKKNTFTDYVDCADHLIAEGYTSADHLYAMGGSAGGLLMGAVVNMRPELFNGVVAAVPFVDVISTMLDESIPLTTGEFDEWGNPKDEEYYHYIKSYSPYDQVEAKDYPNMLVTTGYWDSQVQYWEPAKWVAKLREVKTDDNTLLLHCNMDVGHGGASGRFERFKETAMEYAFFMMLEGIEE